MFVRVTVCRYSNAICRDNVVLLQPLNAYCAVDFGCVLLCEQGSEAFFLCCDDCRDLQSYLSDLSLVLASENRKFYILVDNRPWLRGSRPAHFWQLMVTKVAYPISVVFTSFPFSFSLIDGRLKFNVG